MACVKVREQLSKAGSLLPPVRGSDSGIRLGGKCLHPAGPRQHFSDRNGHGVKRTRLRVDYEKN